MLLCLLVNIHDHKGALDFMNNVKFFNFITQIAIPLFTIGGQLAIAFKKPEFGLILSLFSQPFWLYSSWKSYKTANQIGIFINSVLFLFATIFGIINYWLL